MRKANIITINDNNNYGNRLQNYAVQQVLTKNQCKVITIKNQTRINKSVGKDKFFLKKIYCKLAKVKHWFIKSKRKSCFKQFNKNINMTKRTFYLDGFNKVNKDEYFIVGSDQVWNPTISQLQEFDLAMFTNSPNKISFSASFGISELPEDCKMRAKNALMKFKAISVREEQGKKIAEELTNRKDIEVLVDPTMLLTAEEWDKVSKKPKQLKTDKYILNYFLGELSEKRKAEINKIAKENNCEVINILDKNSPFYQTGPSEFLYLEKNAFLICTDSFHSCIFSIIYNRPFIIFEREQNIVSMNSRIDTLLNKFQLKDRIYNNNEILQEQLKCDYTNAYKILEIEREKSNNFLKKALEM